MLTGLQARSPVRSIGHGIIQSTVGTGMPEATRQLTCIDRRRIMDVGGSCERQSEEQLLGSADDEERQRDRKLEMADSREQRRSARAIVFEQRASWIGAG